MFCTHQLINAGCFLCVTVTSFPCLSCHRKVIVAAISGTVRWSFNQDSIRSCCHIICKEAVVFFFFQGWKVNHPFHFFVFVYFEKYGLPAAGKKFRVCIFRNIVRWCYSAISILWCIVDMGTRSSIGLWGSQGVFPCCPALSRIFLITHTCKKTENRLLITTTLA